MKLFSQNLNTMRRLWRLSQADMANRFGITSPSYSRWESGTEPSYDNLVKLSKFFRLSIDRFLTEEITPDTAPHKYGPVARVDDTLVNENEKIDLQTELTQPLSLDRIEELEREVMRLHQRLDALEG